MATGISGHTLRYYERAELIQSVARNSGNQRRYSADDVGWVKFLLRLRSTGVSIAELQGHEKALTMKVATYRAQLAARQDPQMKGTEDE